MTSSPTTASSETTSSTSTPSTALSSMTGFARSHGAHGNYAFEWEIRTVNSKGFDFRPRTPPGWDGIESSTRKQATAALSRGAVNATLVLRRVHAASDIRVNEGVLASVFKAASEIAGKLDAPPPTIDGILAVKGVIEVNEAEDTEDERAAVEAAVAAAFARALDDLLAMRRREGETLGAVLRARLDELSDLAARADVAPGRKADAVKARVAQQIDALLDASQRFDPDRLHQEALLLATKADIREELDRIASHVAQARELLAKGGAVGRRLDFLAQEFNREVNTCCSKSNDLELTKIGLEMKNVVEQFREQVQNLE